MDIKNKNKILMVIFFIVSLVLLGLSFMNTAFIAAFMLWLSLFVFSICYFIKDDNKKKTEIPLFCVGVLLIIGAIVYTLMRIL